MKDIKQAKLATICAEILNTGCTWEFQDLSRTWYPAYETDNPLGLIADGMLDIRITCVQDLTPLKQVPLAFEDLAGAFLRNTFTPSISYNISRFVEGGLILHVSGAREQAISFSDLLEEGWEYWSVQDSIWRHCSKSVPA